MASHILSDLVAYFTLDEINIDNWVFKLFYKVSTIICMVGAMVGVAQTYFGKPISCQFSTIDQELANDYCWMHGSAYIPPEYQVNIHVKTESHFYSDIKNHMRCIVEQKSNEALTEEYNPQTRYYQWVTFIFAIQVRDQ